MQHRLSVTGTLPKESIPVLRGIEVEGNQSGITFTAASSEEMRSLKRMLSFSLADMITQEYEPKRLADMIDTAHPYLLPEERREVLKSASLAMQKLPANERTHYIENRLYTFLTDSEVLSIDGFVNFRLKDYKERLRTAAEEAAAVYMAEKEYEEFITLLKYFVYMQPSQLSVLHAIIKKDGSFRILNEEEEDVTDTLSADFVQADMGILSSDDLLISLLISLAPREIVLHGVQNFKNTNVPETVFKVFGRRVRLCEMCPICKNEM